MSDCSYVPADLYGEEEVIDAEYLGSALDKRFQRQADIILGKVMRLMTSHGYS